MDITPDHHHKISPRKVKMDAWISCAPFERLLGMEIVEAENGHAVLTMPVVYDFMNSGGLLHGGALVGLADTDETQKKVMLFTSIFKVAKNARIKGVTFDT